MKQQKRTISECAKMAAIIFSAKQQYAIKGGDGKIELACEKIETVM